MNEKKRKVIVILGMHRSATSYVTRVLAAAGADLPLQLMVPNEGALDGYFEPEEVKQFNDRVLSSFGSFWSDPMLPIKRPPYESLFQKFGLEAEKVLRRQYGRSPLFILKDPRITQLCDFWHLVFEHMHVEPHYIACFRDVTEVVTSLYYRDHFNASLASLLWLQANLEIGKWMGKRPVFPVSAALLADEKIMVREFRRVSGLELTGDASLPASQGAHGYTPIMGVQDLPKPLMEWVDHVNKFVKESFPKSGLRSILAIEPEIWSYLEEKRFLLSAHEEHIRLLSVRLQDNASREVMMAKDLAFLQDRTGYFPQPKWHEASEKLDTALRKIGHIETYLKSTDDDRLVEILSQLGTLHQGKKVASEQGEYQGRLPALRSRMLSIARSGQGKALKIYPNLGYGLKHGVASMHSLAYKAAVRIPFARRTWRAGKSFLRIDSRPKRQKEKNDTPSSDVSREKDDDAGEAKGTGHDAAQRPLADTPAEAQTQPDQMPEEAHPQQASETTPSMEAPSESPQVRWIFLIPFNPKISIIIPYYNQHAMTAECLQSLYLAGDLRETEIILANDGSDTPDTEKLYEITGVHYVHSDENLGFLHCCNKAAKEAKGEYIVFLNNDVKVTPGWLRAMLRLIESERTPPVGLVGPKILNEDGTLQEAGGRIKSDGETELIGYGEKADKKAYCFSRPVDYVSGAAMMVRRDLFEEIGGFSELFAPAYGEDVDLCLSVAERGYKVFYCHNSCVYHKMSASMKEKPDLDKLYLCRRNQQKLLEKWYPRIKAYNEVRTIAFYLPQYHVIPENEKWWGKGFTEWTNVAKTAPCYRGHRVPRVPTDLGYYDLRDVTVMERQAAMARKYGVYGFCYYYYWFNGRRLLEMPLERLLHTGRPDFPFCLCWANENWTNTWDGTQKKRHILMEQRYLGRESLERFIADVSAYFCMPNYIRIDGRPLLAVYRVPDIPDHRRAASIWRDWCRKNGIGEIYLAYIGTFKWAFREEGRLVNPREEGFDVSIEMPPHNFFMPGGGKGKEVTKNFSGNLIDYSSAVVGKSLEYPLPNYTHFRGVMSAWDNTPRRGDTATIYTGSNPKIFQDWLRILAWQTRMINHHEEQVIFVNAWNEWAEGAYLEPDADYGYQYLEAHRNAISEKL